MTRPKSVPGEKPLFWTGSSKDDLLTFPEAVIDEIGTALRVAQFGGKHPSAKRWRGEGPGVFEVVEDHRGDTYRAVYTVKIRERHLRTSCLPKEVNERDKDRTERCRADW